MIKVNNFFGCMSLETGGLVIGWFNLVSNILGFLAAVVCTLVLTIYDCDDLKEALEHAGETTVESEFDKACSIGRGVLIMILIVAALIALGFSAIAYLCIKGTERRVASRVKPMMILLAVFSIFSFLRILSFESQAVFSGLVNGIFYGYLFLVIHALYTLFLNESKGMYATHPLQAGYII